MELKKEEVNRKNVVEKPIEKNNADNVNAKNKTAQLISISDLEEEEQEKEEKTTEKRNEELKKEDLQEVWKEYIVLQKEKGKANFATTLDMNEPNLLSDFKIEVLISNKSQEVVIEKEKIDLHEFLRNKLQNDFIEITTKIQEKTAEERVPYTNKDKYEQMAKENTNLKNLKEKLGLDFDF